MIKTYHIDSNIAAKIKNFNELREKQLNIKIGESRYVNAILRNVMSNKNIINKIDREVVAEKKREIINSLNRRAQITFGRSRITATEIGALK